MKSFAFAAVIGVASAVDAQAMSYLNHIATFRRDIVNEAEFNMRMERFNEVDAFIKEHNASNATYTAGHNQFSDWTFAEYKAILGHRRAPGMRSAPVKMDTSAIANSVNWVEAGGVTPVKDQGQCGSCWAFSATGSLEGAHYVASGELLSFSEQQLVDCAFLAYGDLACNGGLASNAYNYYIDGHNAETEDSYPYFSGTTRSKGDCQYDASSASDVTVQSYTTVTPQSVADMKAALGQQPLAVAIEADKLCFQTYSSGIFDNDNCGTSLDHAVLAVGYGSENGQEYWLVKNSWASTWGDQGYIRMAITGDDAGICGVQLEPEYPTTN